MLSSSSVFLFFTYHRRCYNIFNEDENIEVMQDNDTVSLLVEVIKTHIKVKRKSPSFTAFILLNICETLQVADVVKNACMALASIVEADGL